MDLSGKNILITGGTGSFGKACIDALLEHHDPRVIRVFSRDELKQSELRARYADENRLRFLLGDVRDRDRLIRATRGIDVIIHAAALKQVPACEYNPFEAVQTNVIGDRERRRRRDRERGAAHAAAEHRQGGQPGQPVRRHEAVRGEDRHAGQCAGGRLARRGSRASATATSSAAAAASSRSSSSRPRPARITITDERMTRFWITLEQAVEFVLSRLRADGGRRGVRPEDPEHARR